MVGDLKVKLVKAFLRASQQLQQVGVEFTGDEWQGEGSGCEEEEESQQTSVGWHQ